MVGKEGEEPEEEEEEEEELLSREPLLPAAAQRVCVLHPEVRGRAGRKVHDTGQRKGAGWEETGCLGVGSGGEV